MVKGLRMIGNVLMNTMRINFLYKSQHTIMRIRLPPFKSQCCIVITVRASLAYVADDLASQNVAIVILPSISKMIRK